MKYFLCGLLICLNLLGQKNSITGFVSDSLTSEKLIGASVSLIKSKIGTNCDSFGFFLLKLNDASKNDTLKVSFVGYQSLFLPLSSQNSPIYIKLQGNNTLDEVNVRAQKERLDMGSVRMGIEQIRQIPVLLGEVDVLKALTFTPGVTAGAEGSAGIFVRGGTPDQNLILLDDAPLYNASHLAGFFSVFNPNAIKNVDLYKGYFPARFGGRLSSVLDITMRDGNQKTHKGEYTLGLLNQNITLEGPLFSKKKNSSFIVSGRYSNLGLTTLFVKKANNPTGNSNTYQFYDLNMKFRTELTRNDHLFISIFSGRDYVKNQNWTESDENINKVRWGNSLSTVRYNKILGNQLSLRIVAYAANFLNNTNNDAIRDFNNETFLKSLNVKSAIRDYSIKASIDYSITNRITIKTGFENIWHKYTPALRSTNIVSFSDTLNALSQHIYAQERATFIESNLRFLRSLDLKMGARFVNYILEQKQMQSLEPRLALSYYINAKNSISYSYVKMRQYIHLLTNNGTGFSGDIWVPSTNIVEPQRALQHSLGYNFDNLKKKLNFSLDIYYKSLSNQIDYPEGTNFIGYSLIPWQELIEKNGIGRIWGVEAMLKKEFGKWNILSAYTLSKSERKFININLGNWYPMKYDRRHSLSTTINYALSKKWAINSNFVFQTGHATTLPVSAYESPNNDFTLVHNGRNLQRMPAYHRADLGFLRTLKSKPDKMKTLAFGAYNLYNRANPYYLDVTLNYASNTAELRQYSLFPFLPYVSFSSKF